MQRDFAAGVYLSEAPSPPMIPIPPPLPLPHSLLIHTVRGGGGDLTFQIPTFGFLNSHFSELRIGEFYLGSRFFFISDPRSNNNSKKEEGKK
jgi:hypothetical protein